MRPPSYGSKTMLTRGSWVIVWDRGHHMEGLEVQTSKAWSGDVLSSNSRTMASFILPLRCSQRRFESELRRLPTPVPCTRRRLGHPDHQGHKGGGSHRRDPSRG